MDIQNIIESQKEAARDLWFHLLQPLLQQKHSEQGAQDHIQAALEEPPASLGNLCLCSVTYIVKKWFLMFRRNLLCSSLFLFSHQKRDVGFIFFPPQSIQIWGFSLAFFGECFFFHTWIQTIVVICSHTGFLLYSIIKCLLSIGCRILDK